MIYGTVLLRISNRRRIVASSYWPDSFPRSILKKYLNYRLNNDDPSNTVKYKPWLQKNFMFVSRECGDDELLVFVANHLSDESSVVKRINRCASVLRHALKSESLKHIKKEYNNLLNPIIFCKYVIALVGASGVGKTSLLHLLIGQEPPSEYEPTIALNTEVIEDIRFASCELTIIDFAGQEKSRSLWDFENTDLIFLLTDSTLANIIESKAIFSDIKEAYPDLPVVLIANKQDQPNALDPSAIGKVLGEDAHYMVAIDIAYREQLLNLLVQILCRQFEIPVPDVSLDEILGF